MVFEERDGPQNRVISPSCRSTGPYYHIIDCHSVPGPTTSGGLAPPAGTMLSAESFAAASASAAAAIQGLTLVHLSAQHKRFSGDRDI